MKNIFKLLLCSLICFAYTSCNNDKSNEKRIDIPETDIAIDKVILEELGDILMHLIRNALDHGIESPAERKKAGKSEEGKISITCVREAKYIELTISDDGRGLDYDKIRSKAIKLNPERTEEIKQMSDRELSQFLFQSGFSTRDTITELSGRGVGLDVVWSNVEKIKGRIKIESQAGKGTSFILHFPLTLSTLQGLFVFSNKDKYLVPAQHIVDIIYRKRTEYIILQNQNYIKFEDQLIPCFPLSSLFEDKKNTDEHIDIYCSEMRPVIKQVIDTIKSERPSLPGRPADEDLDDGEEIFLDPGDIYYFDHVERKLFAYTEKGVYRLMTTLASVEDQLSPYGFVRISKSNLVNIYKIKQLKPDINMKVYVSFDNGERICINRSYKKSFTEYLQKMRRMA